MSYISDMGYAVEKESYFYTVDKRTLFSVC